MYKMTILSQRNAATNEQLIQQYREGDEEALTELILKNEPLCRKLAERWLGKSYYDDLIQCGRIAIFRAANGYKPELGFNFSTFVYTAIFRGIQTFFKTLNRQRRNTFCFSELFRELDTEYEFEDPAKLFEDQDLYDLLHLNVSKLGKEQREAMELILTGLNQSETAERLGISRQAVCQRVIGARNKLREALCNCGWGTLKRNNYAGNSKMVATE